jgi:transposase
MKRPQEVELSREDGEALMKRLEGNALTAEDRHVLGQILRWYFWLLFTLQEAKLSLKRLRVMLFGAKLTKRHGGAPGESPTTGGSDGGRRVGLLAAGGQTTAADANDHQPSPGGHRPGHGRQGAEAYVGAERVECRHEALAVGERCPVCGLGRLYKVPPGVELRIDGNALLSAIRYELAKLRCSACGQVFTASLPEEAGQERYSPRARAVLAVSRYYLGVPLYRLEGYQAMVGVPVSDATQWDQIEGVADCAYPVFEHLQVLAAQGEVIYQDDTSVRILSLLKENRQAEAQAHGQSPPSERTGMYTTGLVVQVGERTICLYISGRSHAGENLEVLLTHRDADQGKPIVMSDALAANTADEAALIRCHCLAHGRRKFSELEEVWPEECAVVIEALKQVFDHEEEARVQQMNATERLAYHQAYSGPIMEALKQWLDTQFEERLVEPNSSLGKAIAYLRGHWETLTRFLQVERAPLDTNIVERALKLIIRQRKNSLFYATEHSAYIASMLTSLIATCLHAGVNALEYLVALQEHRAAVFGDPAAWLPWNYHANLAPP